MTVRLALVAERFERPPFRQLVVDVDAMNEMPSPRWLVIDDPVSNVDGSFDAVQGVRLTDGVLVRAIGDRSFVAILTDARSRARPGRVHLDAADESEASWAWYASLDAMPTMSASALLEETTARQGEGVVVEWPSPHGGWRLPAGGASERGYAVLTPPDRG